MVIASFRAVPLASLAEVCSTIPEAWAAIGQDVLAHLTAVYDHWFEFEREITQSLEIAS